MEVQKHTNVQNRKRQTDRQSTIFEVWRQTNEDATVELKNLNKVSFLPWQDEKNVEKNLHYF